MNAIARALLPQMVGTFLRNRRTKIELLYTLVLRELKVKYRGSVLGYLWSMLNPLLFMAILTMVFSVFSKGIANYNLYILSGLLFWNFISLSLSLGTTSITRNALLLQKVRVPAWVFTLVAPLFSLLNFILSLIPFTIFFVFQIHEISPYLWLAPITIILAIITVIGLCLTLACLNVFFRDVAHVLEPVLALLFYATPILYDRKNFSPKISMILSLNPFTHFIETFRLAIIGHGELSWKSIAAMLLTAFLSMALGSLVYKKSKKKIIFYV